MSYLNEHPTPCQRLVLQRSTEGAQTEHHFDAFPTVSLYPVLLCSNFFFPGDQKSFSKRGFRDGLGVFAYARDPSEPSTGPMYHEVYHV